MICLCLIYCVFLMSRNSDVNEENFLLKDHFLSERGLWAIIIVIGHAWNDLYLTKLPIGIVTNPITHYGHIAVAGFFFLSGYGMSYKLKGDKFWDGRLLKVLLPYWMTNVVYIICSSIYDHSFDLKACALSFVSPYINRQAWYIFSVIFMYAAYYIAYRLFHDKSEWGEWIFTLIIMFMYTCLAFLLKWGSWWYVSIAGFVIGIFVEKHKNAVEELAFRNKNKIIVATVLFMALQIVFTNMSLFSEGRIGVALKLIMASVFPFVLVANRRFWYIKNPLLDFFGKIAVWIYLSQGFFDLYIMPVMRKQDINEEIIIILALATSILIGTVMSKLYEKGIEIRKNRIY